MKNNTENTAGSDCQKRLVRLIADHGYNVSRDYDALYDMARLKSVVCFVDYHECRDIAATIARTGGDVEVSARGISYVWATSQDDFVMQCRRLNVEFIPLPNALAQLPPRSCPNSEKDVTGG